MNASPRIKGVSSLVTKIQSHITRYTNAKLFSEVGKQTEMVAR